MGSTHLYDIVVYEAGDEGGWVLTSMTLLSMKLEMREGGYSPL